MSGTGNGLPTQPGAGYAGQGLLPTNTTLLQPTTGFFRLFDWLWLLMLTTAQAQPAIANLSADVATDTVSLHDQLADIQRQLDAIIVRLDAAGIA